MKKLFLLAAFICSLLTVQTSNAQNPITTLEHAGATSVYYGQNSLVDAYNASVKGDYLYLSTGYFTAPEAIAKGVKIIGAGHFPDSLSVAKRTTLLSGLTIGAGADSLLLEGLYISGDVNYAADISINYVRVFRCRLVSALFNSSSATASKNYCSYEECFIDGALNFSNYGVNLLVKHNILGGLICTSMYCSTILNINGFALIDGNVIINIAGDWASFYNIISSKVINNIIFAANPFNSCTGNFINNNLFVSKSFDSGNNSFNINYTGVAQTNIFVNQTGNTINYTHDYHLKSPTTYLGTDATQIGLYGGTTPFKDKGLPSNPQVITKTIGTQTDANGNLLINFSVKAQDN